MDIIQTRWESLVKGLVPNVPAAVLFSDRPRPMDEELRARLSREQLAGFAQIRAPEREREWIEARRLEVQLADRIGTGAFRSVAHARTTEGPAVLVVGASWTPAIAGVGVDLEPWDREIPPRAAARLADSREWEAAREAGLSAIDVWVVKEACFKAVPGNRGTVMPAYRLQALEREASGGAFGEVQAPVAGGALRVRFKIFRWGRFAVGLAIAPAAQRSISDQ
ncbi:MAG: 4'-phosphopantetheinyl transferase superfamily protein [Oligoflexia bacterium]|nr:4'-phosphopantetheinyl transferase superfamily protein [Oligoflexia bacterium]